MKRTIKILLFAGLIFLLSPSCEYTNLDLLDNPNEAALEQLDVEFLYNNVQLGFKEFFEETWALAPLSRMGHVSAFRYEEAFPATVGDAMWTQAYSGILPDIKLLENQAKNKNINYQIGTAKILKAYILFSLVDIFGDVPLSDPIVGFDEASPQSRSGEFVYETALNLLDEAVELLEDPLIEIPDNDLYYEGKRENWIALANTLKIRAYLNTHAVDPTALDKAMELIDQANLIDQAEEDFVFNYGINRDNPNTRHPLYNAAYEGNTRPHLSNYYMWLLLGDKGIHDPRWRFYFYRQSFLSRYQQDEQFSCVYHIGKPDRNFIPEHYTLVDPDMPYCIASDIGLMGRDHMNGNGLPPDEDIISAYGMYPFGGQVDLNYPRPIPDGGTLGKKGEGYQPILLSSFTHFMIAELYLYRENYSLLKEHIETAFFQSVDKVLETGSHLDRNLLAYPEGPTTHPPRIGELLYDHVPQASLDYRDYVFTALDSGDAEEKKDVLSKEYLISLWGNALDAYNLYRRTGKPNNIQPALLTDPGDFPRTLLYPSVHVNRNKNVSQKTLSTAVFWDTNDAIIFQR